MIYFCVEKNIVRKKGLEGPDGTAFIPSRLVVTNYERIKGNCVYCTMVGFD